MLVLGSHPIEMSGMERPVSRPTAKAVFYLESQHRHQTKREGLIYSCEKKKHFTICRSADTAIYRTPCKTRKACLRVETELLSVLCQRHWKADINMNAQKNLYILYTKSKVWVSAIMNNNNYIVSIFHLPVMGIWIQCLPTPCNGEKLYVLQKWFIHAYKIIIPLVTSCGHIPYKRPLSQLWKLTRVSLPFHSIQ